ncbi:MAG: hypothetical protein JW942_08730 [Opitutales bacterium]|nr:hypothetical protein [Opitutales bacterium]
MLTNKHSALVFLAALSFCGVLHADCNAEGKGAFQYVRETIPAPSIGANMIGEADEQMLRIFLPPSYAEGQRRYPVMYFFTGYYSDEEIGYLDSVLPQVMRESEYIIVSVKVINSLHGTFGMNSPVTGNWEDFILQDVVSYMDAHYRTLAQRQSRMVCGVSMGGHIALKMGFEHPDVFGLMYSLCPGVFDEQGLENAWSTWDDTFRFAYGAAVAPNPDKPFPHADIPTMDGSPEDMAARARWNRGFGMLPERIDAYLARPVQLEHFCIEVGTKDYYEWIPQGCIYLSRQLFDKKVPHQFVLTTNGHDFSPEIFKEGMGAFAATYLATEEIAQ